MSDYVRKCKPEGNAMNRLIAERAGGRRSHDHDLCAFAPPSLALAAHCKQPGEFVMVLVVLDPRTGERVTFEIAETPQGKRIVKSVRTR
jgi:hypothetical protein